MSQAATGPTHDIDAVTARRLLLGAQGLLDDPESNVDARDVLNMIRRMGFVQIDTINILERAHHLTLFSRMHRYEPAMLRTLLEDSRELFEHWTHDAAVIPTEWFANWKRRFARYRRRDPQHAWWKARLGPRPGRIMADVLAQIDAVGPRMSRDFDPPHDRGPEVKNAWWQWRPHKAALEHLWRCGDLAVVRRTNFQKVYDRTERVLVDHHQQPAPASNAQIDWACRTAIERLVIATPVEIAAFWNDIDRFQAAAWCKRALKSGTLVEVRLRCADGCEVRKSLALHDWRERAERSPDPPRAVRLLSPFDPVVRDRHRARRLFGFEYRFEAFVPAPKRKHGYYVLPMLAGDRLIGRMDASFDRRAGELVVNGQWMESGVKLTARRRRSIRDAYDRLATFVGATRVTMRRS